MLRPFFERNGVLKRPTDGTGRDVGGPQKEGKGRRARRAGPAQGFGPRGKMAEEKKQENGGGAWGSWGWNMVESVGKTITRYVGVGLGKEHTETRVTTGAGAGEEGCARHGKWLLCFGRGLPWEEHPSTR